MKISLCLLVAVIAVAFLSQSQARTLPSSDRPAVAVNQPSPATLTPEERKALLDLLIKTKQDFIQSIQGLSQAQWEFKPSPFAWSCAQTSEHIILSEAYIFGYSQQVMKAPVGERTGHSAEETDKGLMTKVGDRSHRIMNPAAIAPKNPHKTPAEAIAAFTEARDKTIEYVKNTQDDLRHHLAPDGTGGQLDAYEMVMLLAAHSGRHTAQIKEIQGNPKYPVSGAAAGQ